MTTIQTTAARTVTGPTRVQAVAGTVVASLLGNLAVYGVGMAAGGSFDLTSDGATAHVSAATVAGMTVVPLLVGMVLAALLSLRWLGVVRVAQVVGAALSLATIGGTVAADFDAVSTVTLAAMHVVIAAAIVVGLGAMRRRIVA
jgi:hypothetical protein